MRLLICTQAADRADPFLSFFLGWITEFSKHYEHIEVVCLREGEHSLPKNVRVHTLGKESFTTAGADSRIGRLVTRAIYISRLWRTIVALRNEYDAVFVHQSQEFILVGGVMWLLLGKPIYLWRNHYAGSIFTDIASMFCKKVFCTSRFSYTKKYTKSVIMPVGVDTNLFCPRAEIPRLRRSILYFARIAPSKRPHVLLESFATLRESRVKFSAAFYGSALPIDEAYRARLAERVRTGGLSQVTFHDGVPHEQASRIFNTHDIFVNLSRSGMLDKTIFEAAASGCIVLVASGDLAKSVDARCIVDDDAAASVVKKLETLLMLMAEERAQLSSALRKFVVDNHSLAALGQRLAEEIKL